MPRASEAEFDAGLASDDEETAKKSDKLWSLMSTYLASGESEVLSLWCAVR